MMSETKIIVLDDDPTGSQTVHGCLLLTRWDVATLKQGLQDAAPLFFVLTNTRGMSAQQATDITREVCENCRTALSELSAAGHNINPLLVSRSDSTLRGHYPVETDVIAEQLGPFDAHFMIPAFFEGGRKTVNSIHTISIDGMDIPVHETEFARDSVFAYSHSYLPDYVEEKTDGRILASDIERFTINDDDTQILPRLMALQNNTCCVVDAENQPQLNRFSEQLMLAAAQGKRFLFRSAASLLTALAQLPPQPVAAQKMREYVSSNRAGAVIIGSHVSKTTAQLQQLLKARKVGGIEVAVEKIAAEHDALLAGIMEQINHLHSDNITPVIYTSRNELQFDSQQQRLAFGETVSAFLMSIIKKLPTTTGFIISKGGITSNDTLSTGLALKTARVLGQIHAGCSVVRCPHDHERYPDMPVVIFPGNVGTEHSLATVYNILAFEQ